MLHKNMLRCFVIKTSFHRFHFVLHTQNYMVYEVLERITICDLIQNWDMAYVQYTLYSVSFLNIYI